MLLLYLLFINLVLAAPVKIVTRVHTADAVTTTQTYATGTTTVWLPPVQLLVSNGVTYTSTLTESPAGTPTTVTSTVDTQAKAVNTNAANTETANTEAANTEAANTQAANTQAATTNAATTNAAGTTTSTTSISTTSSSTSTTLTQKDTQTTPETTSTSSTSTSSPATTSTDSSSETSSSSDDDSLTAPWGIVYSPYADDGSCKDSSTVESDLNFINDKGISHIRTYGTDCESLGAVLSVSKDLGIKVNQGLWMGSAGADSIDDSVSDLIDYIKQNGDDVFDFITIGNEGVINGYVTVSDLLSKITSVKSKLQDAGYSGKVTTAEPPVSFTSNPSLCDSDSPIDFVSINPHSYFNSEITASQAGDFLQTELELVQKACSSQFDVKITETGYPSKGDTNGLNVPSTANQKIALQSILEQFNGDVTILTTYNDYWKDPGQYNIEQYFGAAYLFK